MRRIADEGNWQARAQMFAVGQTVRLIPGNDTDEGRVVAVWPGIGMIDVQWPNTNYRHPVEDLQVINPGQDQFVAPVHETVPGGAGSAAMVSQGKPQPGSLVKQEPLVQKVQEIPETKSAAQMAARVAKAHLKKAIYWNGVDRKYRCTRAEGESGHYVCPKKCDGVLKPTVYKRMDGTSVKLLGCPKCMFLIRRQDIIDNTDCAEDEVTT